LREAEVFLSQGESLEAIRRKLSITRQTYYRWRKLYGGMRTEQAKRLKELERENGQLKQGSHIAHGRSPRSYWTGKA
jgi:transposase-like protein